MKIDQTYEVVRIDEDDPLKEHPQNPNKGVEETIDESIDENGWYGAVTAQKSTGYIIAGNHRYRVAKKKGAKEIPVIWRDVDDETALKILLVDNKSTRDGEFDEGLLEELLAGLDSLKGTGYVLASAQESIEREDDPEPAQPVSSNGSDPDADDDGPPGPDEIPDDVYEPKYAVMIMCTTAERQKYAFEWLKRNANKEWDVRLTAV
jgi:hypothetical protein